MNKLSLITLLALSVPAMGQEKPLPTEKPIWHKLAIVQTQEFAAKGVVTCQAVVQYACPLILTSPLWGAQVEYSVTWQGLFGATLDAGMHGGVLWQWRDHEGVRVVSHSQDLGAIKPIWADVAYIREIKYSAFFEPWRNYPFSWVHKTAPNFLLTFD